MGSKDKLANAVERFGQKDILLPTYEMMYNPSIIPKKILDELKTIGLWDIHPRNLFRITWKNQPVKHGGGFGEVNFVEVPREITGVKCRIMMLVGKYFPTGAHKVGASYGPLAEKVVRGEFDPTTQKALWPSTGNYCRGGAFNSRLMGCPAIAVLPEEMSSERFEWLKSIGAEVVATPGCESNVKEVFDMNAKLVREGKGNVVSLNQFAEFGNSLWHYNVTGRAMEEVFQKQAKPGDRIAGVCLTQGSAGTLSSADYLKDKFPHIKIAAGEAWQCPTLLINGYGGHRIEGIGDKHVPWIHNVRNTDLVVDIDDDHSIRAMHLFNFPAGHAVLKEKGVPDSFIKDKLELFGISGLANLLGAIKMAKYYEFQEDDVVFSVCTDSMELYQSRLLESKGEYTREQALIDYNVVFKHQAVDHMCEPTYWERKRMHNLKYFTWIEQQGKTIEELDAQWYDKNYWNKRMGEGERIVLDAQIKEFNKKTGLAKKYGLD